jgi:pimeloyl-ACP methyl ester carboxylesterase
MKFVEVNGGKVACWEAGAGPPLVFIHGVGTPGQLWFDDLRPLASHHRLIAYDRRGYGQSSASPRDWRAHRDDAATVVDTLGASPAIIVGYSAGAGIAIDLVLNRPELAAALVLLDPAFNIKRCITAGFVKTILAARVLRRVRGERRGAEHWIRYVASYSTGGTAYDKASPERREMLLSNAAGIFADAESTGGDHIDEGKLRTIAIPTTMIEATLSPSFLRRSCARLRTLMPQANVLTMEGVGHHITIDARDELLATLRHTLGSDIA